MLGSMTPLGERARDASWVRSVTYLTVGSGLGGAVLGFLLGAAGALIPLSERFAATALVVFTIASAFLDMHVLPIRVPTIRRQVDDLWLQKYRSWVYGLGFGFQLGAGIVTVVVTWSIYVTFAASLMSGSPYLGALIGLVFGVVRALPILTVARIRESQQLFQLRARLDRTATLSRRLTPLMEAAVGGLGAFALVMLPLTGGS
jgi:hypothetical protein